MILAALSVASLSIFVGIYLREIRFVCQILIRIPRWFARKGMGHNHNSRDVRNASSRLEPWTEPSPTKRGELTMSNSKDDEDEDDDDDSKKKKKKKKVVWAYWHSGMEKLPGFCRLCLESWRVHLPDWAIVILSDENFRDHVSYADLPPNFGSLKVQHRSDILRLAVLKRYGGLYLDMTYVLLKGLDDLYDRSERDKEVYVVSDLVLGDDVNPMHLPINCFILSASPDHPVVVAWHEKLLAYFRHDENDDENGDGSVVAAKAKEKAIRSGPASSLAEVREHPSFRNVKRHLDDPNLGPLSLLAPYIAAMWMCMDTIYYDEASGDSTVVILPTLPWHVDLMQVQAISMTDEDDVLDMRHGSHGILSYLSRIPNAIRARFGRDPDVAERMIRWMNAVKVSSDFTFDFHEGIEHHVSSPSIVGRMYHASVDRRRPLVQATDVGSRRYRASELRGIARRSCVRASET